MISEDEDALLCDMAETYHVFDTDSLPLLVYARLAAGLKDDSRIKMRINGYRKPLDTLLMAAIFDRLANMYRDKDTPPSNLFETLQKEPGTKKTSHNGRMVFNSPEDFERAWRE